MKNQCTVIVVFSLLAGCSQHSRETHSHLAPAVTTTIARLGVYTATIRAVGRVGGVNGNQANLSFQVPGIIKDVYVHIGDRVSAGEPLADLDARGYDITASQAHADVAVASANARAAGVNRFNTRLTVRSRRVEPRNGALPDRRCAAQRR